MKDEGDSGWGSLGMERGSPSLARRASVRGRRFLVGGVGSGGEVFSASVPDGVGGLLFAWKSGRR